MNKEKYIKKVIRLLNCSQQQKKKIKLDLENDIEMALKNGESFEEIIQRMGTPKELAHEFNENMGVKTRRSYKKNNWHYYGCCRCIDFRCLFIGTFSYS